MRIVFSWILLIVCLYPGALYAEVYTWVDENGNTQFSDQPPPDGTTEAKTVNFELENVVEGGVNKRAELAGARARQEARIESEAHGQPQLSAEYERLLANRLRDCETREYHFGNYISASEWRERRKKAVKACKDKAPGEAEDWIANRNKVFQKLYRDLKEETDRIEELKNYRRSPD